jgi:hypothetical protein
MATPSPSGTASTQQVSATGPIVPLDLDSSSEQEDIPSSSGAKRKLRSDVWADFDQVEVDGVFKAKCKHCKKNLSGITKNGTSHLRSHLKSCIYNKKRQGIKIQSNLRFATKEKWQVAVQNYVFNQEVARRALFYLIILHEYPLLITMAFGSLLLHCNLCLRWERQKLLEGIS